MAAVTVYLVPTHPKMKKKKDSLYFFKFSYRWKGAYFDSYQIISFTDPKSMTDTASVNSLSTDLALYISEVCINVTSQGSIL
jgi:hypothetical protein